MKKTGIAGIFAASLELTKEGIISISQIKQFHKLLIKNVLDSTQYKVYFFL